MATKIQTPDLRICIDVVARILVDAKRDVNFLENVEKALLEGTEEFGPQAMRNARQALLERLAAAQTELAKLIAQTKAQYKV